MCLLNEQIYMLAYIMLVPTVGLSKYMFMLQYSTDEDISNSRGPRAVVTGEEISSRLEQDFFRPQ